MPIYNGVECHQSISQEPQRGFSWPLVAMGCALGRRSQRPLQHWLADSCSPRRKGEWWRPPVYNHVQNFYATWSVARFLCNNRSLISCVTLFQCRLFTTDRSEERRETIVVQAPVNSDIVFRKRDVFLFAGGRQFAIGTIIVVIISADDITDWRRFLV